MIEDVYGGRWNEISSFEFVHRTGLRIGSLSLNSSGIEWYKLPAMVILSAASFWLMETMFAL